MPRMVAASGLRYNQVTLSLASSSQMAEKPLYGNRSIAEYLGVSEATLRRWRKRPEGTFIEVGSMGNAGGGLGLGAWTLPSSADQLKKNMIERIRMERQRAADIRWEMMTDVSSWQAF
jgi:hypothetical protein